MYGTTTAVIGLTMVQARTNSAITPTIPLILWVITTPKSQMALGR